MEDIRQQIQVLIEEKMSLQSQLSQGDYKVIKCAEASIVGDEMPYDKVALHAARQEMRIRINEIDDEITELRKRLEEMAEMPEDKEEPAE